MIALAAFGALMVHAPIAEASSEVTDFGSIEGMPVSKDSLSSELLLRGAKTAFMSGGGDGYRIVGEWDDKNGRRVVMRERARSKIQSKHGLSANAPRVVTSVLPRLEPLTAEIESSTDCRWIIFDVRDGERPGNARNWRLGMFWQ